jgi:plastocyanin
MSIFKIQIKAGKPAVFDPSPLTAHVNDSVFWYNGDQNEPHWPTPDAKKPKEWLDYQIAPDGQSAQISLNPLNPPANYTLNYVCSLHPGEKGQIKVIGKTKKGAFGGKTKKGAFGGKTKKGAFAKTSKKGAFGKTTR